MIELIITNVVYFGKKSVTFAEMDYTTHMFSHRPEKFVLQYDPLPAAHSFLCYTDIGAQRLIDADRPQRKISWQDHASLVKRTAVGLRALGVAEHDGSLCSATTTYIMMCLGTAW